MTTAPTTPGTRAAAADQYTCPCCGWPVGNRAFAPRNGGPTGLGIAPCMAGTDRDADTRPTIPTVQVLERNRP